MATKKTPEKETVTAEAPELNAVPEEQAAQAELMALLKKQQEQIEALQKQQAENETLRKQLAEAKAREESQVAMRNRSDKQVVEEAIRSAEASGVDPWTVTVPVRSRVRKDTTEKHYWLCVNGRTLALPADDQYHELKLPFASALVNAMHAERFAEEFADKKIQVYDPITNPHPTN